MVPTDKPLLFLDVDGVLNPVRPRAEAGFRTHSLLGTRVLLSRAHGRWLRELADVYDLVWATTWEQYANELICPLLGLPALPVVPLTAPEPVAACAMAGGSGRSWSWSGGYDDADALAEDGDWHPILRFADDRPFAWLDDVIPTRLLQSCARREDRLLVPVDPGEGLRRREVDILLRRPPRRPHA